MACVLRDLQNYKSCLTDPVPHPPPPPHTHTHPHPHTHTLARVHMHRNTQTASRPYMSKIIVCVQKHEVGVTCMKTIPLKNGVIAFEQMF